MAAELQLVSRRRSRDPACSGGADAHVWDPWSSAPVPAGRYRDYGSGSGGRLVCPGSRTATLPDIDEAALALPEVTRDPPTGGRPGYQVRGKTFAFARGPRKDAFDPETGEPYDDVLAFSCTAEDKESMVSDPDSPWFTTPHWNGYNAVLLLERDLGRLTAAGGPGGRHRRLAGQGAEAAGGGAPRRFVTAREYPSRGILLSTTRRCHGWIHRQQGRLPEAAATHRGTGARRAEDGRHRHLLHRHPDPGQRHHQGPAGRQPRPARGPRRALRRRRRPGVRRGCAEPRSARRPTRSPGSSAAEHRKENR